MRLVCPLQILTLVLAGSVMAQAAPTSPAPGSVLKKEIPSTSTPTSRRQLDQKESLDPGVLLTEPINKSAEGAVRGHYNSMPATRVVRTQSRALLYGIAAGALEDTTPQTLSLLTLTFQNDNQNETAQSYGLSVSDKSSWGLHWDTQSYCCLGEMAEPYWGFGIGGFYKSSEQLAGLVNVDRYHLRGRIGFEDLFSLGRRLRTELLLRAGMQGASLEIRIGWTWAADEFIF